MPSRRSTPPRPGAAGFTLVELLVSMFILVLVLVGVLLLFDLNSRVARAELHLAEMQQSQRVGQHTIVRSVRMAGRGGLPTFQLPDPPPPAAPVYEGKTLPAGGVALAVRNNVPAAVKIAGCDCAKVVPGTDVLTVRGIINGLVYQINPASGAFSYDPASGADDGSLILSSTSPTGVPQDLDDLRRAIQAANDDGTTEALLVVSPLGDYAVVEITGGATDAGAGPPGTTARIDFKVQNGDHTDDYLKLSRSGVYPPAMSTAAWVGILEEYQYYIREERADPLDPASELMPKLSRARVYPNTAAAWGGDTANLHEDIADNVIDLQIALAIDRNTLELIEEGDDVTMQRSDDDWLFNSPDDDDPTGDEAATALWNNDANPLYFVRVTTVARTDRRDPGYQAPPLTTIEDKVYTVSPFDVVNSRAERMYRRRTLQTVIDLRNV